MFRCIRCGNTLPGPGQFCEQCQELERQEKGIGVPAPSVTSASEPAATTSGASYCASCGTALPAGAQFCQSCGHQIGAAISATGIAGVEYAGFWLRFVAWLIDVIILGIIGFVLGRILDRPVAALIFQLAIGALYHVGFWVMQGATPGKMAMGLKVAMVNGDAIEFGSGFLRWIGYFASSITLGIGYLMIAFSKEKRGLHDLIGGTIVVRARS